jgi:hypothetical protein
MLLWRLAYPRRRWNAKIYIKQQKDGSGHDNYIAK